MTVSRDDIIGSGLGLLLVAALIPMGWAVDWGMAKIDNPFAYEAFFRGLPFDARGPSSFTRDIRRGKAKADLRRTTLMMYPVQFLHGEFKVNGRAVVPLGSGADVTSYPCNEGLRPAFRSDRYGFTNPTSAWHDPEFILLGDSFVEGMCQPEGNRIADYLRKRYRVLNLARAGAGPLTQLAILREYGSLTSPSAVLWFVTDNDFNDLAKELKSPILLEYLADEFTQGLVADSWNINVALLGEANRILKTTSERDSLPWIRTWRLLSGKWRAAAEALAPPLDMKALTGRLKSILAAAQKSTPAPIIVVYLADYRRGQISRKDSALWRKFIDTTIPYGQPEVLHQFGIGHYTALGNELVAENIIHALAAK